MSDILLADYGIRQLHGRYVDAGWRKDTEAFVQCFSEDGEWSVIGIRARGHGEIADTFEKILAACERVMMFMGTPILDIGKDTATGRTYVAEHAIWRDGRVTRTIGTYYDRYVGEGQNWKFQSHHLDLFYSGPLDYSEPILEGPDYGAPPALPKV